MKTILIFAMKAVVTLVVLGGVPLVFCPWTEYGRMTWGGAFADIRDALNYIWRQT